MARRAQHPYVREANEGTTSWIIPGSFHPYPFYRLGARPRFFESIFRKVLVLVSGYSVYIIVDTSASGEKRKKRPRSPAKLIVYVFLHA